jgi:hypothetical protein
MTTSTVDLLYKYGRLTKHSKSFFTTPTIHFSAPPALNDPFECRPWLTFDGERDEVVEWLTKQFQKFHGETPNEAKARAVGLYLEGRHQDPRAWEALRRSIIAMLADRIGICCLSQVPDSTLMWSHYGRDHTGYCVEFAASDTTPLFGAAQPVVYRDAYPSVDFFKTSKDEQVDLVFLTKYSGWAYEQEWRIIDHDAGAGIREYPTELMRRIIFGLRMPKEERQQIREWVSKRGHPVQFFEASQHPQQFAIELGELA